MKAEELETVGSFNKELAIHFVADVIIFQLMMKIPLLIVPAVAFVLIGAVTGHNPYPIYAQTRGQQGNSSDS